MDTSETYIKMRLAAVPDLGMGYPPQKPSHFFTETVWVDAKGDWYYSTKNDCCQLERQDQLQEMVIAKVSADYANTDISPEHRMVMVFASFVNAVRFPYKIPQNDLTSMEQLQLAFVMHELHNKTWNGERWLRQA